MSNNLDLDMCRHIYFTHCFITQHTFTRKNYAMRMDVHIAVYQYIQYCIYEYIFLKNPGNP